MTPGKRIFDVAMALLLAVPLVPFGLLVGLVLLIKEGRPVFYISERMHSATQPFMLIKFRTMRSSASDSGVSGQDKADRITPLGAFLRRTRIDEIPQLWNILRGDMSFVGPRPPLRQYVEQFPDLYARVLQSRPGVTGLATLLYKDVEAQLLRECTTAQATHRVYARRCVPRKATLDMIYQKHRTLCWDFVLMCATVFPHLRRR